MQEVEEWRPAVGYEDQFEISNLGRVRSLDWTSPRGRRFKGRIRKTTRRPDGYHYVNTRDKSSLVHRLVAEAFIPNPDGLPVVDHIDGDPSNNNVNNLRWVTYIQNADNRPAYRELLAEIERLKARVKELESEVKKCQTKDSLSEN